MLLGSKRFYSSPFSSRSQQKQCLAAVKGSTNALSRTSSRGFGYLARQQSGSLQRSPSPSAAVASPPVTADPTAAWGFDSHHQAQEQPHIPLASNPSQTPHESSSDRLFMQICGLAALSMGYAHWSATGFAVPILIPAISDSMDINDEQAGMLSSAYVYLYALALVPCGLLADKLPSRSPLLSVGVAAWSIFTLAAGAATNFESLLLTRIGLAAAQSAQNICAFGMIPDLWPQNKATALSIYNAFMYVGRGIVYSQMNGAVPPKPEPEPLTVETVVASAATVAEQAADTSAAVLSNMSDRLSSALHWLQDLPRTVLSPFSNSAASATPSPADVSSLESLDAAALLFHIPDSVDGHSLLTRWSSDHYNDLLTALAAEHASTTSQAAASLSPASVAEYLKGMVLGSDSIDGWRTLMARLAVPGLLLAVALALLPDTRSSSSSNVQQAQGQQSGALQQQAGNSSMGVLAGLMSNKVFLSVTAAAALNDVASYSFAAWQSTFYERCLGLEVSEYAPVLALLLPVSGILGGVGGGLLADKLAPSGWRWLVTVGASALAAPCMLASIASTTPSLSFAALGIGYALSEAWRSSGAVMARSVASPSHSSTAMSLFLCLRNLGGGIGPLAVGYLSAHGAASCGCDNPADATSMWAAATNMLGDLLGNNSAAVSSMGADGVGLRTALMLLLPAMYIGSSFFFHVAEQELRTQQEFKVVSQSVPQQSVEQQGSAAGQVLARGSSTTLPAEPQGDISLVSASGSMSSDSRDGSSQGAAEPVHVQLTVPASK